MNKISTLILAVSMAVSASAQVLWEGGEIVEGKIVSPIEWVGGIKQVDSGGGSPPPDPNLVLWYQFLDDTTPTPDSSTNANSGVVNGATWSAITNDSVAYLYSFDRVNDYIAAQNTDNEDFIDTNQFSVSTWIRPTLNSGNAVICGWRRVWAAAAYYDSSSRRESVGFVTFNNGTAGPDLIKNTPEFSINWSNWNHVVFTYDKNTQTPADIKIYINGKADQTGFTFGGPPSTMNPSAIVLAPFGVGAHPIDSVSADNFYGGDIGEVMYFTNKVLTQADADEIYLRNASGYGLSTAPRNQLVWYEFNTNTTPTPDSSRYNNVGTVNGATWNASMWYDFDGVNDEISPPDLGFDWLTGVEEGFSASIWFKADSTNTPNSALVTYNDDGLGFYARVNNTTDGDLRVFINSDSGDVDLTTNNVVQVDTWTHLGIVGRDGTNGWGKVFINGSLVYSNNIITGNFEQYGTPVDRVLGVRRGSTGGWFDGSLDDFRLFKDSISDAEMTEIYDSTKGDYGL